ncbi:MAG: glycoside hydrolase family 5 protein, partial [Pseudomonadota bacterium]
LGNALDSPNTEGEWGYYIQYEDLVVLKEAGFDTLRLPVRWSSRVPDRPPFTIRPSFMERVVEVVDWVTELEMNVIIDVHHFAGMNRPTDEVEPKLLAIWDQISAQFKGAPPSVMFEFLNEPNGKMDTAFINQLNEKLLVRLRPDHPDRWMIVSGSRFGHLEGLEELVIDYDPRVILSFHEYQPFKFTHQGIPWGRNPPPKGRAWGSHRDFRMLGERLDRAAAVGERLDMPVFLGEFGVYEGVPVAERALWIRAVREGAEVRNMSWCHWDFAAMFEAYDQRNNRWVKPIRDALLDD